MKIKLEESKFKPIEITFKVTIQTPKELADIKRFTKDFAIHKNLIIHYPTVGQLIIDFCKGVIRDHDGN